MKKRIISLFMVFVLCVSMMPTAFASGTDNLLSLKVTTETPNPAVGEVVTFSVYASAPKKVYGIQAFIQISEGLEYVANSGKLAEGAVEAIGGDSGCVYLEATKQIWLENTMNAMTLTGEVKIAEFKCTAVAAGEANVTLNEISGMDEDGEEIKDSNTGITPATVTIGSSTPALTPVTAANFTMTGYAVGSKITDLKVSGTNTGLKALGGYGDSYTIYKDASCMTPVAVDSTETFTAETDYWLVLKLSAADGYVINSLSKENAKLNGKAAIDRGSDFFIFKLDPLTSAPALTPVTAANFTLDASTYAVGEKIVDLKVSGTNTGLATVGGTGAGYGTGYIICKDEAMTDSVLPGDTDTFAAEADYYLVVTLQAETGYTLTGLTNVKLGTKTADEVRLNPSDSTKGGVIFKLDQLTAPTHTHTKGAWVNEVPATCVATGTKGYYPCTGCDAKLDASGNEITDLTLEKNPAKHATDCVKGTAWEKDGTHHWHKYTKCGAVADKAEHNYVDGATTCSAGCGQTRKLTQTITANNVTFTYNDAPTKIVVNGAKTDVTFEVIEGTDVVSEVEADGTPNYLKAGTAKVKIKAAANDTYYADETTVTVTINKKPITIVSATAIPRDYQQGVKAVEMAAVYFDKASIGGPAQIEITGVMDDDKAGTDKTVHVTVTLKGIAANNYSLADNKCDTTVTINKIDPTAPSGLTGKTGNKLSSVTLPDGWSWIAPNTTMSEAGEKQFAAKYVDTTGNYKDVASKNLTVVVSDKLAQTITASDVTATYGETKTINASTAGDGALSYAVKSGDDVVTVGADGKLTFKKAGTAVVTVTAAETADYAKGIKDVTVTVNKAAVTVTAKNHKIYVNGTAPDLTAADAYVVSGLVNGDTATVSLAYSETPDVTKTGSYDIIVTAAVDTDKYDLTSVNGKLTISKRSSSGGAAASAYAITVEKTTNGTVTASAKSAVKGEVITITVKADKGCELETLTVLDKNGKEIKLTEKNGKYTFTMPASKVTVKATFAEENSFVDVPSDAYYADAVQWGVKNGITAGTDAVHFAPDMTCTRAQAVTFLWNAAGKPAPKSTEMPFADVKADSYYYNAVLWAVENGITKGTSETTFSPDMDCTRAHIVTFLWNSQKSPVISAANPFVDVAADAYYAKAVAWAVKQGITSGTSATTFSPDMDCTRAQIVTFLYNSAK